MKSYLGLYKTLHMATPNISQKDSEEPKSTYRTCTHCISLILKTISSSNAAHNKPSIGYTIYAVKEDKLVPVCFYLVKLKEGCKSWPLCKVEALAFAMVIEAKYNLLRESKNPPPS